eukprot:3705579-Pyramimonas_sp.AAC.1
MSASTESQSSRKGRRVTLPLSPHSMPQEVMFAVHSFQTSGRWAASGRRADRAEGSMTCEPEPAAGGGARGSAGP